MTRKEMVELVKTGNFTIAYHDNCHAYLYKGRKTYEKLPEQELHDFNRVCYGYIPDEVALLVEALGGKVVTI